MALALAGALEAAHAAGVLHRDVKPANVLFTENGSPKMTDFGIAKLMDPDPATTRSAGLGTPMYMAPEQILGEQVGPATDLYSLASVLYELLTGTPVFGHDTPNLLAFIRRKVDEDPPPMDIAVLPAAVADVVMRALARNPAHRPPSAKVFAAELAYATARAFGLTWLADAEVPVYLGDAVRSAASDVTARLAASPSPTPVLSPTPSAPGQNALVPGGRHQLAAPDAHASQDPLLADLSISGVHPVATTRLISVGPPTPKSTEGAKWENNYSGDPDIRR